MKYYGTLTSIPYEMILKIEEYGYNGHHNQFRIVCKAKSRAEANRIAKSLGLWENTFKPNFSCETGNKTEIELSDKYGFIIATDGTMGRKYIDIKELTVK